MTFRPTVRYDRSPSVAGRFYSTPQGVIIHGSRSGRDWSAMEEFEATVRWAVSGANGWGWNAREHSREYLAVEVAQAREGDPVDDFTVLALAWYIKNVLRAYWPDLPDNYPMHSELPAGQRDGKTDLYPPGPDADAFRARLLNALTALDDGR